MAIDLSALFGQQPDYSQFISPAEQQRLQSNAGQQALLNAAISALAMTGQTRQPISTGQVLAGMLGAGMEGYNQSFDRTLKQMVTGMQLEDYKRKRQAQEMAQKAFVQTPQPIPMATGPKSQLGMLADPMFGGDMPGVRGEDRAITETANTLKANLPTKTTLDMNKLMQALSRSGTEGLIQAAKLAEPKKAKESYRPLTLEEKKAYGLPQDQTFQISSSGKIDQVSKGELVKNIIDKGDSELEKLDAQQIAAMSARTNSSREFANNAAAINNLLKGAGGGVTVKVGAELATALGLPSQTADANALATALQTRAATQVRAAGSGSTSDLEFKSYLSVFPSLMNSEQGRALMAKGLQAFAERDALIEKKSRELFREKKYSAQAIAEYDRSLGPVLGEEFKPFMNQSGTAKPARRSF
jgi:hypothetical protein